MFEKKLENKPQTVQIVNEDPKSTRKLMSHAMKDILTDSTEDKMILKELFKTDQIEARTELMSIEEAGDFSKFYWVAMMKFGKTTKLKKLLDKQLELRLSNKRKSRQEFIEGFKHGDVNREQKRGFFDRMGF